MKFNEMVLGCEQLGGADWGSHDPASARAAVERALELGITLFDTADVYGLGRGEQELGRALGARRRDVTIITKGGVRWSGGADGTRATTWRDSSPGYLRSAIEASLRRLALDVIPVYLVHWPDADTPLEATLECLEQARARGLIASYGLSNFEPSVVLLAASHFNVTASESSLNLLSPVQQVEGFRALRARGISTLGYGALAQGLLTGKYSMGHAFEAGDRRRRLGHFTDEAFIHYRPVLKALAAVAGTLGRSQAEVAIRWVLDRGGATSVVIGARSPAQVSANCGAVGWTLSNADVARLDEARFAAGLGGGEPPGIDSPTGQE